MADRDFTEVPEADALEQKLEVATDDELVPPTGDPEAPEADALEQARTVPVEDEYEGRG
ncbi:MAG: hypothetical protein M3179_06025 [Actinomycetota bacterium]|nr:hypothetical protein [Actinomycetota bacterium]